MAELDSRPVSSVRDFTPVRPTLPPPEQITSDGVTRKFSIRTEKGVVHVAKFHEWQLRGHPEALEAFGVIKLDWLPGLPGNMKTHQIVVFAPDGRALMGAWPGKRPNLPSLSIEKASRTTFRVRLPLTSEERAEYEEFRRLQDERSGREHRARHKREDADARIATLPESSDEYRTLCFARVGVGMIKARAMLQGWGGFRASDELLDEFDEAALRIRHVILKSRVLFDKRARDGLIIAERARVAGNDPLFQQFLAKVVVGKG